MLPRRRRCAIVIFHLATQQISNFKNLPRLSEPSCHSQNTISESPKLGTLRINHAQTITKITLAVVMPFFGTVLLVT